MRRYKSVGTFRSGMTARQALAIAAATVLAAAGHASAGIPDTSNQFINPGTGAWTDPANWSYGAVPTFADVTFANQGTAGIGAGDAAQTALLTLNGTAAVDMTGGSLTSPGDIRVGYAAGDNASFTQSGGDVRIATRSGLWAGNAGTGTITLSGGTTTIGTPQSYASDYGNVIIGNGAGGNGTLNINGGTLTNYALTLVSRSGGTGTINMTAGTWNMATDFGHGTTNGKVTIDQSGGTINVGTYISYPRASATVLGSFVLGLNTATRSTYTMSGSAELNVNAHLYIGGGAGINPHPQANNYGHADLVMNGGTITLGNANNRTGVLYVGNSTGTASSSGTVTLNDESATLNARAGIVLGNRLTSGAANGTGTLTINAGQVLAPTASVTIGRVANTLGAHGTLNLAGGRLQTSSIIMVKPSTGTPTQVFNWTGGDLEINSAQMS